MSEHDAERLAWRAYHASYTLFRQNGVPEADCEDLAHEVVYRLLCHLHRGNPVCDRWIETVARHLLSDYHHKRTQEREAFAHCTHECAGGGRRGVVLLAVSSRGSGTTARSTACLADGLRRERH